uniref:Zinc finger protein 593 homolog n=1 Tax=Caenorhabditis tropicalis TaxID=1561998 RepID=A0A1I7SXH2_9PELO
MPSGGQRKHTISNKTRKRPGKDLDQIHDDLKPEKAAKLLQQEVDYDLPGNGQFYCIECERHFIDEKTRQLHRKTKLHKNRVKTLKEVPYTQAEANAAGGSGFFPAVTMKTRVELPKQPEISAHSVNIEEK